MQELKKIRNVISKVVERAPSEVYLVIDGNTGQNAIIQAQEFLKVTDITGLIITKLDGTAKGGALFQITSILNIPIKYIGVGEGIEDLQNFDAELYVNSIFD
jgi:fused signal recognition particle receptor